MERTSDSESGVLFCNLDVPALHKIRKIYEKEEFH